MTWCRAFEHRQRVLWRKLAAYSSEANGLIVTKEFFRWKRKYYKVTDKVDVAGLDVDNVYQRVAS
jgi:hypothetical protein